MGPGVPRAADSGATMSYIERLDTRVATCPRATPKVTMNLGTSYKRLRFERAFDTVVIGSGMGGLATAALLAKHAGERVLVLERHYTAGGYTHAFRRPGYEWDVGVHYIGEVNDPRSPVRRFFDHLTGGELEWADLGDVYDTVQLGARRVQLVRGQAALVERLGHEFPSERDAIVRYLAYVRRVMRDAFFYYAEKVVPAPVADLLGGALRWPALRHARRTTREVLGSYFRDRELIGVLSAQWGDYGLPPSRGSFLVHAMAQNHYLEGAAYPRGGASRIAETFLPTIERAGGVVATLADVDRILVEGGRAVGVRMADGREIRAPRVVSDAGVAVTLGRLLDAPARAQLGPAAELRGVEPSTAHLSLYLGLDRSAAELGLPRSNLWVYPGPDHDTNLERYLADRSAPLPVAFLSYPSARDPDFERRHPGRATIEVVTLAPWADFAPWQGTRAHKRGADYTEIKARLTEQLLAPVLREHPGLAPRIAHQELSTPLTTQHYAGHPSGEIYGLDHSPARFQKRWLAPRTKIRGFYLTGSDVSSCGVVGALMGGYLTASAMLGKNLLAAAQRDRKTRTTRVSLAPRPA